VNKEVEQSAPRSSPQYATLGVYTRHVTKRRRETMAKVSVELGSRGTMTSQNADRERATELADRCKDR